MDRDQFNATLSEAIDQGDAIGIRALVEELEFADVADLLSHSPAPSRRALWESFDETFKGNVIAYVDEDLIAELFAEQTAEEIAQVIERVPDADDLTDIIQNLPLAVGDEILESLDETNRSRIEKLLTYPTDSAGGLMDTDLVSVRQDVTIDVVLRYLRRHQQLPDATDQIFVVSEEGKFLGNLAINRILVSDPNTLVADCMDQRFEGIPATLSRREVATVFERYDLISMPVLDDEGFLVGRVTIDDVVDVIIDEADHSILGMAGLSEEDDTFAPVLSSVQRRAVWLGANLLTAFLASAVINLFQNTIEKVVALAVLMPIVASMGGVAGSQTLTLVIRGMGQGIIHSNNASWLVRREVGVGVVNGLGWAVVVGLGTLLVFSDRQLAFIIAIALIINISVAAITGAILPQLLSKLGIDPAIAGMVVLTTVTDVVGFLSFLGLAALFYA